SAHCLATPVDKVPPFRNAPSPPQIYTLSLHDALPISTPAAYIADITLVPHISGRVEYRVETVGDGAVTVEILDPAGRPVAKAEGDRKSTRLNSSHVSISYAVFCLKKKIDAERSVGRLQ